MGEVDQLVLEDAACGDDDPAQGGGILRDLVAQGEQSLLIQQEARHQGIAQHLVERRDDGDRAGIPGPAEVFMGRRHRGAVLGHGSCSSSLTIIILITSIAAHIPALSSHRSGPPLRTIDRRGIDAVVAEIRARGEKI